MLFKFIVYKLINPKSICGYPFLATTENRSSLIEFNKDHVGIISNVSQEANQWLNIDYIQTEQAFQFEVVAIIDQVKKTFNEPDFNLTVRFKNRKVSAIEFSFGSETEYYELELRNSDKDGCVRFVSNRETAIPAGKMEVDLFNKISLAIQPVYEILF